MNTLPNHVLCIIFKRVPIQKVFILRKVCRNWKTLCEESVIRARQSLTVFLYEPEELYDNPKTMKPSEQLRYQIEDYWEEYVDEMANCCRIGEDPTQKWVLNSDWLMIPYFEIDDGFCLDLKRHFPNITKLQVIHFERGNETSMEELNQLLSFFSVKLVTFKLWQFGAIDIVLDVEHLVTFLFILNNMYNLRNLVLSFDQHFLEAIAARYDYDRWTFEALSRVERFFLISQDEAFSLHPSLTRIGHFNPRLRHLALRNQIQDPDTLGVYFQLDDEIAKRCTQLMFYCDSITVGLNLVLFCGKFPNLVTLYLDIGNTISLHELSSKISSLKHLKKLGLMMGLEEDDPVPGRDWNFSTERIYRLESITKLDIAVRSLAHNCFASYRLGYMFPNLIKVKVVNHATECQLCGWSNGQRRFECLMLMLLPWQHIFIPDCNICATFSQD